MPINEFLCLFYDLYLGEGVRLQADGFCEFDLLEETYSSKELKNMNREFVHVSN